MSLRKGTWDVLHAQNCLKIDFLVFSKQSTLALST